MPETLPDTSIIEKRGLALVEQARSIEIKSQHDYVAAQRFGQECAGLLKEIKATFEQPTRLAFAAHKAIVSAEKKHAEPVERAKQMVAQKAGTWAAEQDRIRREKEAELQAQARKLEEDRLLAEAMALEAQGKPEEAARALAAPIQAPVVMVASEVPKVAGVKIVRHWKFRIVDPNLIPHEYLVPDEVRIGQIVRALKEQANIPGVQVYAEDSSSFTAATPEEEF